MPVQSLVHLAITWTSRALARMYQFQHLVNLLNQMLTALFAIFLAIWLKLRNARKAKGLTIEDFAFASDLTLPVAREITRLIAEGAHGVGG